MSLNLIGRPVNSLEDIDVLKRSRFTSSSLKEENLYQHHRMMRTGSILKELKEIIEETNTKAQLFEEDYNEFSNYIVEVIQRNIVRVEYLQSLITNYESERESARLSLESSKIRAQKKISYLNSKQNFFSWFFEEMFFNFDLINTTQEVKVNINTNSGECTLPISNKEPAIPSDMVLGRRTDCIIGAPEGGNNKLTNLFYSGEESVFSCYSDSSETCNLEIEFSFNRSQVINFLSLKQSINTKCFLNKVDEIILYDDNQNAYLVSELCNSNMEFQKNSILEIHFLPVRTKKVKLFLKQENFYFLNEVKTKQIDLDEISFFGIHYSDTGSFESKELSFGNYLSLKTEVSSFPEELLTESMDLKLEQGNVNKTLTVNGEPTLLDNYLSVIKLKVNLEKYFPTNKITTKRSEFYNYSNNGALFFNPVIEKRVFIPKEYELSRVKACHLIGGEILNTSNQNIDISFNIENDNNNLIIMEIDHGDSNNLHLTHPNSYSKDNTEVNKNALIKKSRVTPFVKKQDSFYHFELGEYFELSSLKIKYDSNTIQDFLIYEENDKVSGAAVSIENISFPKKDYILNNYKSNVENKYSFGVSIVKGTLLFTSDLIAGYDEVGYIDGSEEFKVYSTSSEEILNSQNVNSGDIIAFELSHQVNENPAYLYKDDVLVSTVVKEANVDPDSLITNVPKLDTVSNVLYLKTDEDSFFTGYSIRYTYDSDAFSENKYFSIDYLGGILYFSHPIDESLRVSFESYTNLSCEFDLARYFDLSFEDNYALIYDRNSPLNLRLNKMYIYLPEGNETVDISDLKDYYSPVIYSIKVMGS